MAELKTKRTRESVKAFLDRVPDDGTRRDAHAVADMMAQITKEQPAMWGTSIVGFGSYHYKYASGQEGDWPVVGFSPRKRNLTLYIMPGFQGYQDLLAKLGKHKTGRSCLYINSLDDVHVPTLKTLIRQAVKQTAKIVKERSARQ
ncbi:MAG: DUF1801 domain-containing protein [Gemmatimonadaceae bacterium]